MKIFVNRITIILRVLFFLFLQDHNHLWVVQSVQGDPLRELFSRRSMESFLSQLEARRGRTADFSPPLSDLGVGEVGPAAKKPRLTLDEGIPPVAKFYKVLLCI